MRGYIDRGKFANMDLIYWPVHLSSMRGGDGGKGGGWGVSLF